MTANNYLPIWTCTTSEGYRIRFTFTEFSFYWNNYDYNLLDIGDGLNQDDDTRLATFGGRAIPSNVTSVSNVAWLKVTGPAWIRLIHRSTPKMCYATSFTC